MEQFQNILVISILLLFYPRGRYTQSPCPDNFEYKNDESGKYGLLHVFPKERVNSITTSVNFTVATELPTRYVGKLESLGEDLALIQQFNKGKPIHYRLHFPVTSPLPKITSIRLNGDVICTGTGDSIRRQNVVTSVGLQHTLYLKTGGTDYTSPSHRPAVVYDTDNEATWPPFTPGNVFVWGQDGTNVDATWPIWNGGKDNVIIISNTPGGSTASRPPVSFDWGSIFRQPQTTPKPVTQETPRPTTSPRPVPEESLEQSTGCGLNNNNRYNVVQLIYEGTIYDRGMWPWTVAIFRQKDLMLSYICAGTLVSDRHVISAGHCIHSKTSQTRTPIKDLRVVLGAYKLTEWDDNTKQRTLSSAITPHNFDRHKLVNDISLLTFTERVEFTSYISAACLWSGNPDLNVIAGKSIGVVTGWGVDEYSEAGKGEPRQLYMPIVSTEQCRASKLAFHQITSNTTLCAGDRKGAGPCSGDSGGGLYVTNNGRWTLRGIVSSSLRTMNPETSNCDLQEYVVFTDAAQYQKWITDNMRN